MGTENDDAINLLNKGIAEKHKGNYDEAIDYYKKAKTLYPEYPVTYMNLAKIFIICGKYENAIRNLLTNIHLKIVMHEEIINPEFEQHYQIDNKELKQVQLNYKAVINLIKESHFNEQIAKEINVTFYAGLAYVGMNPTFLKHHKINKSLIESEREVLSGKIPSSENLRQSKYVNLINLIGLKWLIDNLNTGLKYQNEICNYYLDSTIEIKKPDTKVFDAKRKEIFEYTWWEVIKMLIVMPFMLLPEVFKTIWENIVAKNKKFHKRVIDVLASPFIFVFGTLILIPAFIIMKATGKKKDLPIKSEEKNEQVETYLKPKSDYTYKDAIESTESIESEDQQYEQWKAQFHEKSILEQLAEVSAQAKMRQEEGFAGMVLNINELIYLHMQNKIEYKFINAGDSDGVTLFIQMEIDEYTLGIGNSNKLEIYQCKLDRYININGKNEAGLPEGVYEFEITNLPTIGFSHSSTNSNISKKIFIEDEAFERQTMLIIGASGIYDDQIRRTIGLEKFNSKRS